MPTRVIAAAALLAGAISAQATEPIVIEAGTTTAREAEPEVLPESDRRQQPDHRVQVIANGGALPLLCWGLSSQALALEPTSWCGIRGRFSVLGQGRLTAGFALTADLHMVADLVDPDDLLTDIGVGAGGAWDIGRLLRLGFSLGPSLQVFGFVDDTVGAYRNSTSLALAFRLQLEIRPSPAIRFGYRSRATVGTEVARAWTDGRRSDVVDWEASLDSRTVAVIFARVPADTLVGAWI